MTDHARMQRTKRPHKSAVWKKRGQDYLKRGRYEDAIHAFEQSLLHYPDADDYIYKGMILAQLGRSEEALATFEHAIELDPNNAPAYVHTGSALQELGRLVKTLYLLRFIDDEGYRRRILIQLNRGEGRHQLARVIFHGRRGELRQRYREGQED